MNHAQRSLLLFQNTQSNDDTIYIDALHVQAINDIIITIQAHHQQ